MATPTLKPASATMEERTAELREKRAKIKEGGGKQRIQKQHEGGQAHRAGTHRQTGRSRQLPGDRSVRQASRHLLRHGRQRSARRRRGHRMRDHRWPPGPPGLPGFHGSGRRSRRSALRQNRRDDEAFHEDGKPVHLRERFRRRACAGRHRQPGGLRQRVLQQRHAFRDCAADFHHLRTLCRRRGLQSRR